MTTEVEVYKPKNDIRVVTATSLFDGHDAAINIIPATNTARITELPQSTALLT